MSRPTPEPIVLVADQAVPELGIEPGEFVTVEPGSRRPVTCERELRSNYRQLFVALSESKLRALTADAREVLHRLAGGRHLTLVGGRSGAGPAPRGAA